MLNYSNAFSFSVDGKKNEFVLSFKQRYPILNEDGDVTSIQTDTVATVVLNRDGLDALRDLLNTSTGD
jgi:hypothetical protein